MAEPATSETTPPARTRVSGIGVVLVAIYAILALAATGRSTVQILRDFSEAPFAYSLSALAAVVYIVATLSLIVPGAVWKRIAWITISFELLFVLVVGTLSVVDAELFPRDTVWSYYGAGYLFFPVITPVLGLIWLGRNHRVVIPRAR
ncbi:hypothetical protein ACFSBZ_00265 [Amnibacterium flavum]|uniref:Uncharacterized protein n=1 Tax=Amnibacterium flavum TaxID=2173173 RepID=A0A2V1HPU7_9MICO|nr:hypothetical protein [Amnibacterium flavum]PVZ93632.1 hypothetical protein DDQ50_15120 [Amnibacterium flavum]